MTGTTASMNQESLNFDIQKILNIVKAVASDPKTGWETVKNEFPTIKSLYINFLAPILILVAICHFIKVSIIGTTLPYIGTIRISPQAGITSAIVLVIQQLVMMYIGAVILTKLAHSFEGSTDELRALRLIAFSASIACVASILMLIPFLGFLFGIVLLLYALYIFYSGITVMTGVPDSRKLVYAIVSFLSLIVVGVTFQILLRLIGVGV